MTLSLEDDKVVDLNHLLWRPQVWKPYSPRQSRLTAMNDSTKDVYNWEDPRNSSWEGAFYPESVPGILSAPRVNQSSPSLSTFNFAELDQNSASTTSDSSHGYTFHAEPNAFDAPYSDSCNSSDRIVSFNSLPVEHQVNQDELCTQSSMSYQNINYPSSKHRDRPSCDHPGCDKDFKTKSELDRHRDTIHEGGGILCGDCKNVNSNDKTKLRNDRFIRHLLQKHGVAGATKKSLLTCPFELCRPRNPKQQLCFSTQESLNFHLLKEHDIPSQSSRHVPPDQFLSSSSRGPAGSSESLVNSKRLWEDNPHQAAKRLRSAPSTVLNPGLEKENKTKRDGINSLGVSTDISALPYETPDPETVNALTCYVDDISPYDFIKANSLWDQVAEFAHPFLVPGIPCLSFDASRRQIKVCLRTDFSRKAIRDCIVKGLIDRESVTEQPSLEARHYVRNSFSPLKPPRAKVSDYSTKVFPIRKTEDSAVIGLWNKYIIPALFNILDKSVGDDYTASLVRAGDSPESADPVIHIESPHLPGPYTRVDIRGQIDKACGTSLQEAGIEVQFFEGSLILLAGQRAPEPSEEPKRSLPFYTRFWKHAGMGASIGLLCSATEFATLGCYIIVDDKKYILTVDHFIGKSYGSRTTDHQNNRVTLNSPAVAKVKRITQELQLFKTHLAAELKALIIQTFPDGIQPEATENIPVEILDLTWKLDEVNMWLKEHNKDNNVDFQIGCLSFRCEKGAVASLSSSHSMVGQDTSDYPGGIDAGHRLDWALFRVDPIDSRKGKNRYRYLNNNFHPEGEKIDEGEGDICQQTRVVEGGESVRFVGAGIGPHDGVINGALQAVSQGGRKTLEHQIIMDAEYANKEASEYAGASGAAVVTVPENEILGLLWGYSKYPTFTPIRTVFEDIRRVTEAQKVELHRDSEENISAPANETLLISGSDPDVLELHPYKSEDIVTPPLTSEKMAELSKRFWESHFRAPSKHPQSNTTTDTEDESRSTMPSLSSSRASSPGTLPSTPKEQSNEVLVISESTQQLVPVAGEDIETFSGSDMEDGDTFEGSPFKQPLRSKSAIPRKSSIPPIISDRQQMPKEHLFCPQPNPRWNTWPWLERLDG